MATSGTVGTTVFTFDDILTIAARRCKLNPAVITAESIQTAKRTLYLNLVSMANTGLNLWRIQRHYLSVVPGQPVYQLPVGTIDLANINFVTNTADTDGILAAVPDGYTYAPSDNAAVPIVGIKFSATFTGALTFQESNDSGATWFGSKTIASDTYVADTWYWFDMKVIATCNLIQVTSLDAVMALSAMAVSTKATPIPVTQWNRDEFSQQTTRFSSGRPSTNYMYDRQVAPEVQIWPNPTGEHDFLEIWVHREIEDILTMTEEVDIPMRWMNAAVWLVAEELCFCEPSVDPSIVGAVMEKAAAVKREAELGESDGAPIKIQPKVRNYNRG